MFNLLNVVHGPVTRECALQHHMLRRVPGDRPLNQTRVAYLCSQYDQGKMTVLRWATAECRGELYRVNGQHTSYIFKDKRDPAGISAVNEHYLVADVTELVDLYNRFDSKNNVRTVRDIVNTTASLDDRLLKVPQRVRLASTSALATFLYGEAFQNRIDLSHRANLALSHIDFVLWANEALRGGKPGGAERMGVYFAALLTYHVDPQRAFAFWREVIEGTNSDPISATRQLERNLLMYAGETGSTKITGKIRLRWDEQAAFCLVAWRAWLDGRSLRFLKLPKDGLSRFWPGCLPTTEEP